MKSSKITILFCIKPKPKFEAEAVLNEKRGIRSYPNICAKLNFLVGPNILWQQTVFLTKSEQSYVVFFAAASSIVFVNKYLINLYFSPK